MSSAQFSELKSLLQGLETEVTALNDMVPSSKKRPESTAASENCVQQVDAIINTQTEVSVHVEAIKNKLSVIIPDLGYLREAIPENAVSPDQCNDVRLWALVNEIFSPPSH
ncbi:unnamed protein product [Clonostachys solani]|uniref:Uncharacterized protein n=1 Tax=Clonostachys solani TaxID=160281 RepID=A0A9N9Z2A1_9HYPO|nr:unnamed protein product [Clonostachys solani]